MMFGQKLTTNPLGGPGAALFNKGASPAPQTRSTPPGLVKLMNLGGGLGMGPKMTPQTHTVNTGPTWRRVPNNDISQAGAGEQAYAQHGQKFFEPGPMQQFQQQHGAAFMQPDANQQLWEQHRAAGPMGNNAQREYNSFRKPNIATEPGYGAFYDNAQKNTVNALNTQLGARGAYGSSVGLGQIGKSVTDLRADQARTEADYNIRRLTEQRGWNQLGGELARSADLTAQGNRAHEGTLASNASSSRLAGLQGAGNLAQAASSERAQGLQGGMTAALSAQGARENRIGTNLNALMGRAQGIGGLIGQSWDNLLGNDQQLLDGQLTGGLGASRERVNQQSQNNPLNQMGQIANAWNGFRGAPAPQTNYYGYQPQPYGYPQYPQQDYGQYAQPEQASAGYGGNLAPSYQPFQPPSYDPYHNSR